ncbi:ABC transporter ATP-binding protein [Actinomadura soli]|uniref:ABC transporter ATP-binding protein n=1 Tax=Actinomadura soli TaxID=2508997 RepID=UPI00197AA140|nr:ABC transporter ATP-binding protein [Actinomadura soli]
MTDTPALEVRRLTTGYGESTVLRDLSLTVPAGGVVALLGPNGAGKTTLLRAVSGLLPAQSGQVLMGGRTITNIRAHERARAGVCHVPEGGGIFPSLTVRENLVMQAIPGGEAEATERAVAAFPILGDRLRQRAGTLSGGQRRMLAIAAAHVRNPALLLVDEASLGLAPIVVEEIFDFLRRLAADRAAILIVDQFAVRALEFAQSAYVLRKGEIVFDGGAEDLLGSDLFSHYLGAPPIPGADLGRPRP